MVMPNHLKCNTEKPKMMQDKIDKQVWEKPEFYILDFKKTNDGNISHPTIEDGLYSATQNTSP
jgi:hypothetical protein